MRKIRWSKILVFLLCLAPLARLGWLAWQQDLGANPIERITHFTGDWTLRLLVATLAVTPLRKLLGMPVLIRFRRMLGLFAFFYGSLHFLTYIWLDKFFDLHDVAKDIGKRPFITVGFSGVRAADPSGGDQHGRLDPAHGRPALAASAPADLRQRGAGGGALLLAGEVRHPAAGVLRDAGGRAAGLPSGRVPERPERCGGARQRQPAGAASAGHRLIPHCSEA